MTFDNLVANPGRLTILTALAVDPQQEFVSLRNRTKLTDGNLASHARRLASAGMIEIDKQLRSGKPVTTIQLTSSGRTALESHVRRLMAAISHRRVEQGPAIATATINSPAPISRPSLPIAATAAVELTASEDEWVD
jgi:DNA-binding MarR family transcriptional regulator